MDYRIGDRQAVQGFLMALGNAFGLFMVVIFLGHGLVEVPRSLWRSANHRRSLMRLECKAPGEREKLVEAETELCDLLAVRYHKTLNYQL